MSHYSQIKTQFRNPDHVVNALKAVGATDVEVHDEPVTLIGSAGYASTSKAHIVVRRSNMRFLVADVGFRRKDDGSYELIHDDYEDDYRVERKQITDTLVNRLADQYARLTTIEMMMSEGYQVLTDTVENGEIKLLFSRETMY